MLLIFLPGHVYASLTLKVIQLTHKHTGFRVSWLNKNDFIDASFPEKRRDGDHNDVLIADTENKY